VRPSPGLAVMDISNRPSLVRPDQAQLVPLAPSATSEGATVLDRLLTVLEDQCGAGWVRGRVAIVLNETPERISPSSLSSYIRPRVRAGHSLELRGRILRLVGVLVVVPLIWGCESGPYGCPPAEGSARSVTTGAQPVAAVDPCPPGTSDGSMFGLPVYILSTPAAQPGVTIAIQRPFAAP